MTGDCTIGAHLWFVGPHGEYCAKCDPVQGIMPKDQPETREMPDITYKPGWTISWHEANDAIFVRIHVERPDAKGWDAVTGGDRKVNFLMLVPMPFDPTWLLEQIEHIETHEIREWLRVDGVLVDDQHSNDKEPS